MYVFSDQFYGNAHFISAGIFIRNEPWIHSSRIIDTCEIIYGIDGILPMEVGDKKYDVKPGELLFIPPDVPHKGARKTEGKVKFFWFHFTLDAIQTCTEKEVEYFIHHTQNYNCLLLLPRYSGELDMHRLNLMCNQLMDIYQGRVPASYCNAYLNCILFEITYQSISLIQTRQIDKNEIQPIQDWIRIHAFEDISLESIADYFNYNKNYLSRKYKKQFGMGITTQIIKYRVDQAKILLTDSNMSIQEIAAYVGYDDAKYFMRIFKKKENMTPTEYRHTFCKRHYNKK